jgi:hypothetical protein
LINHFTHFTVTDYDNIHLFFSFILFICGKGNSFSLITEVKCRVFATFANSVKRGLNL